MTIYECESRSAAVVCADETTLEARSTTPARKSWEPFPKWKRCLTWVLQGLVVAIAWVLLMPGAAAGEAGSDVPEGDNEPEAGGGSDDGEQGVDPCPGSGDSEALDGGSGTTAQLLGPVLNVSRLGAVLRDPGRVSMGSGNARMPIFSTGWVVGQFLSETPLAELPDTRSGSVAPDTGAFLWRFTLVDLPDFTHTGAMGLSLSAYYRSNGNVETRPYGSEALGENFYLSGTDRLIETVPGEVTLYNAASAQSEFDAVSGQAPGVAANITFQAPDHYELARGDGRRIRYGRSAVNSFVFLPESVTDPFGNQITYTHVGERLESITSATGIVVRLEWSTVAPAVDRVTRIYLDDQTYSGDPYEVLLDYDQATGRLTDVEYPYLERLVHDADQDGIFELPGEVLGASPHFEITYASNGLIEQIRNVTVPSDAVVVVENQWGQHPMLGEFVEHQSEGGGLQDPDAIGYTFVPDLTATTNSRTIQSAGLDLVLDLDYAMRPTTYTLISKRNPRTSEALPGESNDHAQLVYDVSYACCSLVDLVTTPTGKTCQIMWDLTTMKPFEMTVTDPADPSNTRYYKIEYSGPNGEVSTFARGRDSGDLEWTRTFDYTVQGGPGTVGLQQVTLITDPVIDGRGQPHLPISEQWHMDALGRLDKVVSGAGVTTMITYGSAAPQTPAEHYPFLIIRDPSSLDPQGKDLFEYRVIDDRGRLETSLSPAKVVQYTFDTMNRVTDYEYEGVYGAVGLLEERYFDVHGNAAVTRWQNLDGSGLARARPWVKVRELHIDSAGRTVAANRDVAPLEAASSIIHTTSYEYSGDRLQSATVRPNGSRVEWEYDGYGKLYRKVVDVGGLDLVPVRRYYDQEGYLVRILDGELNGIDVIRDGLGQLVETIHGTGDAKSEVTYDGAGRVIRLQSGSIDANRAFVDVLRDERWEYDGADRVIAHGRALDPGNASSALVRTIFEWNDDGRLIRASQPENSGDTDPVAGYQRSLIREYDSAGRLVEIRENDSDDPALCNRMAYLYTPGTSQVASTVSVEVEETLHERVVTSGIPRYYLTDYERDGLGRLTSMTQHRQSGSTQTPAALVWSYEYDSFDNRVELTDPEGARVTSSWDAVGRRVARTEVGTTGSESIAVGATHLLTASGWRTDRSDAEGKASNYQFDNADLLVRVENPGYSAGQSAHLVAYEYDDAGRLEFVNDGDVRFRIDRDGRGATTAYTLLSSSPFISQLVVREEFEYDAVGRLSAMESFRPNDVSNVRVEFPRDDLGRPLGETYDFLDGVTQQSLTKLYTQFDDGTGLEDYDLPTHTVHGSTGYVARFERYRSGALSSMDLRSPGSGGYLDLVDHRRLGHLRLRSSRTSLFGGGATHLDTEYSWDAHRRLAGLDLEDDLGQLQVGFSFEYDDAGFMNRRTYDDLGREDVFDLSELYVLEGAKLGTDSLGLPYENVVTYDEHLEYDYDAAHDFLSITGTAATIPFTVDAASHRYTQVDGVPHYYDDRGNLVYNGRNILVYDFRNRLTEIQDIQAQLMGVKIHDPFGRPVINASPIGMALQVFDGWQEAYDVDPAGTPLLVQFQQEELDRAVAYAWNDPQTGWRLLHYLRGPQRSVEALYDDTGAVVERYRYDPFGRPTILDGTGTTPRAVPLYGNLFLFAGRRLDPFTGFYDFRRREYDSYIGRYTSPDPLGVWGDEAHYGNPYTYAGNSPLTHLDPMGLQVERTETVEWGSDRMTDLFDSPRPDNTVDTVGLGSIPNAGPVTFHFNGDGELVQVTQSGHTLNQYEAKPPTEPPTAMTTGADGTADAPSAQGEPVRELVTTPESTPEDGAESELTPAQKAQLEHLMKLIDYCENGGKFPGFSMKIRDLPPPPDPEEDPPSGGDQQGQGKGN